MFSLAVGLDCIPTLLLILELAESNTLTLPITTHVQTVQGSTEVCIWDTGVKLQLGGASQRVDSIST